MGALDRQILAEMERQRELIERLLADKAASQPEPAMQPETAGCELMTDYDCLMICSADDVLGAIDRWNRSRKGKASQH